MGKKAKSIKSTDDRTVAISGQPEEVVSSQYDVTYWPRFNADTQQYMQIGNVSVLKCGLIELCFITKSRK